MQLRKIASDVAETQLYNGRLNLADLPDWDWYDVSAHLKCTACGKVGWVDTRLDWGQVINLAKGVS